MLDKLVQLFIDFISLGKFWYVIEPYEAGHSFHFGARGRTIESNNGLFGSGLHFIWPLNITDVRYFDITDESAELRAVDLVTKDALPVKVGGVFRYRIRPDRAWEFITLLGDDSSAITDFMSMAMAKAVSEATLSELFSSEAVIQWKVVEEARRQLNRYGVKILDFYWNYKAAPSRIIRVMTE